MKVTIFTLCEAATVTAGKLNILGTFEMTMVPQVPCRHPGCAVAMQLRFESTEAGNHPWQLSFVDDDGKVLQKIGGNINVQVPEGEDHVVAPSAVMLQQFPLPQYGDFEMRLTIDNQEVASAPLGVRRPPAQPMAV
jgi:hypothetical protein